VTTVNNHKEIRIIFKLKEIKSPKSFGKVLEMFYIHMLIHAEFD